MSNRASGRWVTIDLGLREAMYDWDRRTASVTDESTGEKVGFIDLNDGKRLRVWINDATDEGDDRG